MKKRLIAVAVGVLLVVVVIIFGRVFQIRSIEERYEVAPVEHNAGDVITATGIECGDSILGLNETRIKKRVASAYSDNSIVITDIERVFPNKTIICVEERVPIMAIKTENKENVYALADVDFQLNYMVCADELPQNLIKIENATVNTTFNSYRFVRIREVLMGYCDYGVPSYALPELIDKIEYGDEIITVYYKDGKTLAVNNDSDIRENVKKALSADN